MRVPGTLTILVILNYVSGWHPDGLLSLEFGCASLELGAGARHFDYSDNSELCKCLAP